MIGRRDQRLGVRHFEYGGFNGLNLHRLLAPDPRSLERLLA
jgi:hypothetical protein